MNKDTYIWFSPSGEMFNCFKSDWIHNDGVAVHNQWATGYIAEKIIGCEDWEFDVVMKFVKGNGCEYPYEYLEKIVWIRYLPWSGHFSTQDKTKYTTNIRKSVKDFCLDNSISLPTVFEEKV